MYLTAFYVITVMIFIYCPTSLSVNTRSTRSKTELFGLRLVFSTLSSAIKMSSLHLADLSRTVRLSTVGCWRPLPSRLLLMEALEDVVLVGFVTNDAT